MQEYNDFALPSIENIEQMAKAYQKYKQESANVIFKDASQTQKLYNAIYNFCNCVDFVYSQNVNNKNCLIIFNLAKKLKLDIDGVVLDYNINKVKLDKVNADNVLFNLLSYYNQIVQQCMQNINSEVMIKFCKSATNIVNYLCNIK